jgi:hypothetical protein
VRRRLIVAKAERIDTTQLELEFAAKLEPLDEGCCETAGSLRPERRDRQREPEPVATPARCSTEPRGVIPASLCHWWVHHERYRPI